MRLPATADAARGLRYGLPRMPSFALLRPWAHALLLAVTLPACGAKVVVDVDDAGADAGAGAAPVCPAQQPTSDVALNCHGYCAIYVCLGCTPTAAACESACVATAPSATLSNPGWPACLACAVGNIDQLVDELACSDSFSSSGQVLFTLTYPLDVCTTCGGP